MCSSVQGVVLQEQPEGDCQSPVSQRPNLPLGLSGCSMLDATVLRPALPRARGCRVDHGYKIPGASTAGAVGISATFYAARIFYLVILTPGCLDLVLAACFVPKQCSVHADLPAGVPGPAPEEPAPEVPYWVPPSVFQCLRAPMTVPRLSSARPTAGRSTWCGSVRSQRGQKLQRAACGGRVLPSPGLAASLVAASGAAQ